MNYEIKETLLPLYMNRPGTPITPTMVVIHETASPNATDEAHYKYFCGGNRDASAHYFVDYDSISRFIPDNEKAWHAGSIANGRGVSIELCHFDDPAQFQEVWNRGVFLTADICKRWGFDPGTSIVSHAWCANTWHESDHQDPIAYFQNHGKTMQDFINDVITEMNGGQTEYRVHVGYIYESYLTKREAVIRAWTIFNSGYGEVILTGPDFNGEYVLADHQDENALNYKIHLSQWMYESYKNKDEAYSRGWYLYNNGYSGVYLEDVDGNYTFDKHQDENPLIFKIHLPGQYILETYLDENEAIARGWALFNDASESYKDVYLIDKAGDKYEFGAHESENPLSQTPKDTLWRLKDGNKQLGAFSILDNAKAEGWRLFNTGIIDVILYSPEGYTYTFHEHQDENPVKK